MTQPKINLFLPLQKKRRKIYPASYIPLPHDLPQVPNTSKNWVTLPPLSPSALFVPLVNLTVSFLAFLLQGIIGKSIENSFFRLIYIEIHFSVNLQRNSNLLANLQRIKRSISKFIQFIIIFKNYRLGGWWIGGEVVSGTALLRGSYLFACVFFIFAHLTYLWISNFVKFPIVFDEYPIIFAEFLIMYVEFPIVYVISYNFCWISYNFFETDV